MTANKTVLLQFHYAVIIVEHLITIENAMGEKVRESIMLIRYYV